MIQNRAALRSPFLLILAVALGLALLPHRVAGHDIPDQIVINGFVKPAGQTLHVILRIPLAMLASVNLPKRGPGYLALDRMNEALTRSVQATAREIELYEDGTRLTHIRARARISQPSERAFETYEDARAHVAGPALPADTTVFWNQGYFDVQYEYPIRSDRSNFALDFQVARGLSGRLKMVVRFMPPDGSVVAYVVHGGFGRLALNPDWDHAASLFVRLGTVHILDGIDHLLFVVGLVIPFGLRQFWNLVAVVTSFTVAHSITLAASALDVVPVGAWFPPLIEVLIALSIFYMALENIVAALRKRTDGGILRWRWIITGLFGLVHGFGFSFALKEDLQFAGTHLLLSLLSFNLGVEIGQVVVLAAVLLAAALLFRTPFVRRFGVIAVSALLAHTAWHWMIERAGPLRYVDWPALDAEFWAALILGLLAAGLLGGAAWLWLKWVDRRAREAPPRSTDR